jgi:hypothetical protein
METKIVFSHFAIEDLLWSWFLEIIIITIDREQRRKKVAMIATLESQIYASKFWNVFQNKNYDVTPPFNTKPIVSLCSLRTLKIKTWETLGPYLPPPPPRYQIMSWSLKEKIGQKLLFLIKFSWSSIAFSGSYPPPRIKFQLRYQQLGP